MTQIERLLPKGIVAFLLGLAFIAVQIFIAYRVFGVMVARRELSQQASMVREVLRLKSEISDLAIKLEPLRAEFGRLSTDVADLDTKRREKEGLKLEADRLGRDVQSLKNDQIRLQEVVAELHSKQSKLEIEKTALEADKDNLEKNERELKQKQVALADDIASKEEELLRLGNELKVRTDLNKKLETMLDGLGGELEKKD